MIQKMTDLEYFALPGVSNSLLGRLEKCPAALDIEFTPSPAMLLGTLAHCLILEGCEEFEKRYVVAPECDKRTNAGKALWSEFTAANPDKVLITVDQLQAVAGMAASVASHPDARALLSSGEPEMAFFWEEGGEQCRGKADWLSSTALIDLKTTSDASYNQFSKSVFNFAYQRQFAFYRSGLAANGIFPEQHVIIAVESKEPYTVATYSLTDDVLAYGEGQYKALLKLYSQIKDLEVKPTYQTAGRSEIYLPAWLKETE